MRIEFGGSLVQTALAEFLPELDSPEAVSFLVAIAHQESRWVHRRQVGGPARGFWQFEAIGVFEVFRHPASAVLATRVLRDLGYPANYPPVMIHQALEHNDLLAACIARLAVRRHPAPLPLTPELGWAQYLQIWRPGKPHPDTWLDAWRTGFVPSLEAPTGGRKQNV